MELDPATGSMASDRLPQNVVPRHYSLTLEPNWDSFTFEGNVVIEYVSTLYQQYGIVSLTAVVI
jgi:hypothetical protein